MHGEIRGDVGAYGVLLLDPGAGFACLAHEVLDADGDEVHFDLLGVELRYFDGFRDEPVEAVTFFVNDGEEFDGLLGSDAGCEKRGCGALDGGERRAQLVGDGVDDEGAEALAFLGGLVCGRCCRVPGRARCEMETSPPMASAVAVGEGDAADDEQAFGTDAGAQRGCSMAPAVFAAIA